MNPIPFIMKFLFFCLIILSQTTLNSQNMRPREYGIYFGELPPGKLNSITDVPGVKVGHYTMIMDSVVRTGVTAIIPHLRNTFEYKVPAGIFVGNGFGKLAGTTQVEELGNIETPILLTNTLNVSTGMDALISYTLNQNPEIRSVNGIVGETNDGYLNDISGRHLKVKHFLEAIDIADTSMVSEGNVGAGTGTICFGYKGGIGSASRMVNVLDNEYHIGVLVQTNFGGQLRIGGMPISQLLNNSGADSKDGSCMIVVATDAPILSRNLKRLAKRAMLGLARCGGIASNGSGDYVIAFSNYEANLVSNDALHTFTEIDNGLMTKVFQACIEATEEAIVNSLFAAESMTGYKGRMIQKIPVDTIIREMNNKGLLQRKNKDED